jgi:phosphoglucosamine mutase
VLAAEPDGTNINLGCGATHPEFLAAHRRGRVGLAFDGDADRLIAVDEDGEVANGDVIMAIIARHWKAQGVAQRTWWWPRSCPISGSASRWPRRASR